MQSEEKQRTERWLLEHVYDPDLFDSIVQGEEPDFRLTQPDGITFGTEVTELWTDESDARARKIPGYMSRLFSGGGHLHKDDVHRLQVVTVSISSPDGETRVVETPAVFQEASSAEEHWDRLADCIERKNRAFAHYDASLDHINLVIADYFDARTSFGDEYNTADVLVPRLRTAIGQSPFRSIILLSDIGPARTVRRSLDIMALMEAFMVYLEVINNSPTALGIVTAPDIAPLFALAMQASDEPVELRNDAGAPFVGRGRFGLAYREQAGPIVHDYQERTPEPWSEPYDRSHISPELEAELLAAFQTLRPDAGLIWGYREKPRHVPWKPAHFDEAP